MQSCLDPAFAISKKQRLHFLPIIIDLVPQLLACIFVGGVLAGILRNRPQTWGYAIDTYNVYSDIPRWVSLTLYLFLSYRYLMRVKTNNEKLRHWITQFVRVFLVFQLIWFIT